MSLLQKEIRQVQNQDRRSKTLLAHMQACPEKPHPQHLYVGLCCLFCVQYSERPLYQVQSRHHRRFGHGNMGWNA